MAEPLLELREVSAGYGDGIVLDHVSVGLPEGGSLALLGRIGGGTTTVIVSVRGYRTSSRSTVCFPGSGSGAPTWATSFPAANSRC